MDSRVKNAIISSVLLVVILVIWLYRKDNQQEQLFNEAYKISFTGKTMGTTYSIKYLDLEQRDFKSQADSLLQQINQSLSTYIEDSEISRFNQGDTLEFDLPYFLPVLKRSVEVYENTYGAFDPTVMPLVNYWGFGPEDSEFTDSATVDSLLTLVGFDKVVFDDDKVIKKIPNLQIDFSAVAKGYAVDVISLYLLDQGIRNLMVEIGGEVYCQGKNEKGQVWLIGIDNPRPEKPGEWLKAKIRLENRAVATSGNYRNFYVKDGKMIAHTISPYTGYPIQQEVLSASVFADDCMTSDAYATAFMVLGLEKTKEVLEKNPEIDAYLIYSNENGDLQTFYTEDIQQFIEEI